MRRWRRACESAHSHLAEEGFRTPFQAEKEEEEEEHNSRNSHSEISTLLFELFLVRLLWRCREFGGVWVFYSSWYVLASAAQRQFGGLRLQLVLWG